MTTFRTWSPDPTVDAVLRSASSVRTIGGYLFLLAGSLYIWVTAVNRAHAGLEVALQWSLISVVVGWRIRVPRSAAPAQYDPRGLRFLAKTMGVTCPEVRMIAHDHERVLLRGRPSRPAILLSPRSLLLWQHDVKAHSVQLAHEMGHLWARDLSRTYFLATGIAVVSIELLPFLVHNGNEDWLVFTIAAIASLFSLRSFLREREIAADFLAAQVLGADARDALSAAQAVEGGLFHFWVHHPSPAQRRRAFDEPAALYEDLRLPLFAFGFSCALALNMIGAGYRLTLGGSRTVALQASLVPMAVLVSLVFGSLLACGGFLAPKSARRSWFRSFLLGVVLCFSLLTHELVSVTTAVYAAAALVAAGILAPVAEVVMALVSEAERTYAWRHRIAQALAPTLAWIGIVELYYFWHHL